MIRLRALREKRGLSLRKLARVAGVHYVSLARLEAGAFDLLAAPYNHRAVLHVLEQAVESSVARRFHHPASWPKAS